MKYHPIEYAKAFAQALSEKKKTADALVKNFSRLIAKNGDIHGKEKILAATERFLRPVTDTKSVTITTAREIPGIRFHFQHLIRAHDIVRETVDPSLIGGVKVIINDAQQFDGSLKWKIDKLFSDTHNS